MRKVIAAINMTLDGFCDHTALIADDEIHQHYTDLLRSADTILYGRITYQLMEYWRTVLENPTGNKSFDDFAVAIDNIPKVVFSHSLKDITWKTARLTTRNIKEEVLKLKQETGKDILIGSRSLIITLMNLGLIDEFQLCIQPIIAGKGLPLFENINDRTEFRLLKTKIFNNSGSMLFYYEPIKK
ncbi:MAG: dihydrofolate reductase family protein [Sphingobacteriales bacterium]|nr:dihydrofolate reductase family protein [Sphingobacteriales bacterium]